MGMRGPPPHCVGCERERHDCRKLSIGRVCADCRVMLADVMKWQHEALHRRPPRRLPRAVTIARWVK